MKIRQKLVVAAASLLITACSSNFLHSGSNYTVKSGDTLNSIANKFKVSASSIAKANSLTPPYRLRAGQTIVIKDGANNTLPPAEPQIVDEPAPVSANTPAQVQNSASNASASTPLTSSAGSAPALSSTRISENVTWSWPVQGNLMNNSDQKGIDITGTAGQPVYAAAGGQVLFSGVGPAGYGNMIIIKVNNTLLTAYGNNQKLKVKEGQQVSRGQQIATMGQSNQLASLHFEIRKNGSAVNPLNYLPTN